jgi:hypothetical protein
MISKQLLIYPPYHKYKLDNIEFKINLKTEKFDGPLINRNTKYWNDLYKMYDLCYKNKNKLAKGMILFRCSTEKDPMIINNSYDKSEVVYFGLDFVIAIWIGLEINEKSDNYVPCYLHIYEFQKDISYKYLISVGDFDGVPMDLDPKTCIKKACVHPQEILHGDEYPYKGNELGSEITFPRKNFDKIIKNLKPLKTFEIDIEMLRKNKEKYIFEWDPKNALK